MRKNSQKTWKNSASEKADHKNGQTREKGHRDKASFKKRKNERDKEAGGSRYKRFG